MEEYVNFEHMKLVLELLQQGIGQTEKVMIRQGESDSGESSAEISRKSSIY